MTKPQEYYIAIGLFFDQWHRCKTFCDAFFKDAVRSYEHMNISEARCFYESMCKCLEDIDPSELTYEPKLNSTNQSND